MKARYALSRRKATELLRSGGVSEPPVPVERLASLAGATVRFEPFEGALSGMLYRSAEGAIIGVNSLHPASRQRFTIAHEIGHLLLHEPQLQIDERAFVVFRDLISSKATDPNEIEANQFAATLLMPEELLREAVLALTDRNDVEASILQLAEQFEVSKESMTIRLTRLGWIID